MPDIPEREDKPCPWCGRLTRFERDVGNGKSALMHVWPTCRGFLEFVRADPDFVRDSKQVYDPTTGTYREVKGEA